MAERLDPKYLLIGQIVRPHGVRGEARMRILTDYPERLRQLKQVYLAHDPTAPSPRRHQVAGVRMNQDVALLRLAGITDRNQVEPLRGLYVMVELADAVPLDDDEVYLFQLIGMRVVTDAGAELGTLTDVLETGANDVYVVDSPQHGEVLIPVIPDTIVATDTEQNRITVRLPAGLLPGA